MRVDARRNRARLLAAARDVFVEQGVDAPLDEVARRAGVGIATLYRRFPTRAALMRGVALDVLSRVTDEAREALADEADGMRALSRYLHRALHLRIAAVMPVLDGRLDIEGDDEVRGARDALAPLFELIVDRARAAGLRTDVGLGDIGLMVIRLARPLPGSFARNVDDAVAHRQLDVMLAGLFASADRRPGSGGLTLEDVRESRNRLAQPQTDEYPPAMEMIRRQQEAFDRAELTADVATLRRLLTEDFQSIGPKGFVLDKDEWIDRHRHFTYHALDTAEMDIRLYSDAAIVSNVQRNDATYQDSRTQLTVRVSQTWVRIDGDWRLAGIQFSPLAEG